MSFRTADSKTGTSLLLGGMGESRFRREVRKQGAREEGAGGHESLGG